MEVIDDLDTSILKCSFGGQNLTEVKKKKNGMQRNGHSTNNLFSVSLQKRTESSSWTGSLPHVCMVMGTNKDKIDYIQLLIEKTFGEENQVNAGTIKKYLQTLDKCSEKLREELVAGDVITVKDAATLSELDFELQDIVAEESTQPDGAERVKAEIERIKNETKKKQDRKSVV